mmetsp:Transcript_59305/g.86796  ORF Transcript_59305/g.86796 Transcript_59305/m.86796 type:complete len:95 (+) Transcript_59305:213-497(+)
MKWNQGQNAIEERRNQSHHRLTLIQCHNTWAQMLDLVTVLSMTKGNGSAFQVSFSWGAVTVEVMRSTSILIITLRLRFFKKKLIGLNGRTRRCS